MKLNYEAKILSANNCGKCKQFWLKRRIRNLRLDELEYFPCFCPECNENDPQSVTTMAGIERQKCSLQQIFALVFLT